MKSVNTVMIGSLSVSHDVATGKTKIYNTVTKQRASLATSAFRVFQNLNVYLKNKELKELLVAVGACKDIQSAGGLIEKFCKTFSNYNGWCQLLEGHIINGDRHFVGVMIGQEGQGTQMMIQRKPKELKAG